MSDIARCVVDVIEAQRVYDRHCKSGTMYRSHARDDAERALIAAKLNLDESLASEIDARIEAILDRREKEGRG